MLALKQEVKVGMCRVVQPSLVPYLLPIACHSGTVRDKAVKTHLHVTLARAVRKPHCPVRRATKCMPPTFDPALQSRPPPAQRWTALQMEADLRRPGLSLSPMSLAPRQSATPGAASRAGMVWTPHVSTAARASLGRRTRQHPAP
eukprot:350178-Chlamydomonas_euryale.AAC.7